MLQSIILAMTPFNGKCQNLQKINTFFALALRFSVIILKKINLKKVGHGHRVQFLQWHHSMANAKIYQRHTHFCANFYHFRDIKFKNFDFQKIGQGHRVQFSQWHLSMENAKIYRCLSHIFALALTVSEIEPILKNVPSKSSSWSHIVVQFSQWHHLMANVKIYKCLPQIFVLSYHFRDIQISNFLPLKNRSRSQSTIFPITPFDGKYQNLQTSFFTFLICAKVWPVRTKLTYTRQTHTEMDNPIAIEKILQICFIIMANKHLQKKTVFVDAQHCTDNNQSFFLFKP